MSSLQTIQLPKSLKKWIDGEAAKQGFSTSDKLVADILRRERAREAIDQQILDGLNSGGSKEMTDRDWDRIRAAGQRRARVRKK